jgi:hypothetical protein
MIAARVECEEALLEAARKEQRESGHGSLSVCLQRVLAKQQQKVASKGRKARQQQQKGNPQLLSGVELVMNRNRIKEQPQLSRKALMQLLEQQQQQHQLSHRSNSSQASASSTTSSSTHSAKAQCDAMMAHYKQLNRAQSRNTQSRVGMEVGRPMG